MEQKIDLEIRLRELASQAMLEAQDEIDVLEVEKSLLTSDQRLLCYAAQLEQRRKQIGSRSVSTDSGRGSSKSGVDYGQSRLNGRQQFIRGDVIGPSGADTTSSPSCISSPQTPSKLSPVSGQSIDLPSLTLNEPTKNMASGSGQPLRTGGLQRSSNTISRNRYRNKQREQMTQSITSSSNSNCNMMVHNRVSLSVSEIRIPLMWRDVDHFKGRGDYKRFAMFCLLKIDSQIYDTQLISDIDRDITDVTFDDVVVFNDVEHNFELKLEVYSCVYLEEFSLSSAPRKLKEKLSSSIGRTMGRWLASQTASVNYTKELEAYDRSYRFALIASTSLKLEDSSDSVKAYDLPTVAQSAHHKTSTLSNTYSKRSQQSMYYNMCQSDANQSNGSIGGSTRDTNKNTLPLFGYFCCKLVVRPDVSNKNTRAGYLRVAM